MRDLGPHWTDGAHTENVDINGCVVWDMSDNTYHVFVTTDTSQTAENILRTYCLRPEIEEDYRQLKEFWKLEDFKSTKLNVIVFHVVAVLFGYLFFHLYIMLPDGEQYAGKSLPIVLKNYVAKVQGYIVLYIGGEFGIFTLLEMMKLYAASEGGVRAKIDIVMEKLR